MVTNPSKPTRAAVNFQFFQGLVKLFPGKFRAGAQIFDRARLASERREGFLQVLDGRIVAIEEEVVRALVGIGVHQVGPAGSAIAARAANFLIEALESGRQTGVDHGADVGLVDAHAECDRSDDGLQFACLEGLLHTVARLSVEAGMVRGGWKRGGQLRCQTFGLFPRSSVHNGRPPRGIGQ